MNHKAVAKIDTGAVQEVMSVTVAVDPTAITSAAELGAWAQKRFSTSIEPRPPRTRKTEREVVLFMGKEVLPAEIWRQRLYAPNAILLVEYVAGSNSVKVTRSAQNFLGVIKNLHKVSGMNIGWVLLFDTMAGALIVMTLSGALLWSRLHGPRLGALGIFFGSISLAVVSAFPSFL